LRWRFSVGTADDPTQRRVGRRNQEPVVTA
jgi:hypothetical protein